MILALAVVVSGFPDEQSQGFPSLHVAELVSVGVASCNKHDLDQSFWPTLGGAVRRHGDARADAFVWLGDVVYNDYSPFPGIWLPSTMEAMQTKLTTFKNMPGYSNFVASRVHATATAPNVFGVWDDHDMGKNDGGKEYSMKTVTEQLFLDFLDVPSDSPRRNRRGVYAAHALPLDLTRLPSSTRLTERAQALLKNKEFAMCVVLLDGRFDRDPLGSNGDMLGSEQWEWLDKLFADPTFEFGASKATAAARSSGQPPLTLTDRCLVTFIGSGVQVLSDEKPTESWGQFPAARRR